MSRGTHLLLVQLGKRIQSLRKNKRWTQTDLAVHLDMNRGHISDIEQGMGSLEGRNWQLGQNLLDSDHDSKCCDLSRPRPNASHP
jgi:DNA-binding XRE family transcriptional regulator